MNTSVMAIFEGGAFRPTVPLKLAEGTRVELIIVKEGDGVPNGDSAAEILATIAALPTAGGDPSTSRDHDRILYGELGAR
jgi:predicted DNA-binding antitoxin AbrB/MazE fold protein